MNLKNGEALTIYGWFTGSIIVSQIFGAVLGDLIIGNKKSIIVGGIIQTVSLFVLCASPITFLYLGLILVVLGSGFYTPNILSNFGKTCLKKARYLDSGFTLFYLAITLGSFLGILLIGYLGNTYGFKVGFIVSGILMLISILPILITEENKLSNFKPNRLSKSKNLSNIFIATIALGLFWGLYEISSIQFFDIQLKLNEVQTLNIPDYLWQSINSIIIVPISIIAFILWTYFGFSQFLKLTLGFIFGAIAFWFMFLIPETPTKSHFFNYLTSLLFLGIAEILVTPIVYAILTKYSNPKYLAILFSLVFLSVKLISIVFSYFNDKFYDKPIIGLETGIIGMFSIGIGLIAFVLFKKTEPTKESVENE